MIDNFAMASFGLTSAALAAYLPRGKGGLAGWIYFLIGFYHWISGSMAGSHERKLRLAMEKQNTSHLGATR
jgi:lipopolysaccharide export LptBFGC system permease protein LptF